MANFRKWQQRLLSDAPSPSINVIRGGSVSAIPNSGPKQSIPPRPGEGWHWSGRHSRLELPPLPKLQSLSQHMITSASRSSSNDDGGKSSLLQRPAMLDCPQRRNTGSKEASPSRARLVADDGGMLLTKERTVIFLFMKRCRTHATSTHVKNISVCGERGARASICD